MGRVSLHYNDSALFLSKIHPRVEIERNAKCRVTSRQRIIVETYEVAKQSIVAFVSDEIREKTDYTVVHCSPIHFFLGEITDERRKFVLTKPALIS